MKFTLAAFTILLIGSLAIRTFAAPPAAGHNTLKLELAEPENQIRADRIELARVEMELAKLEADQKFKNGEALTARAIGGSNSSASAINKALADTFEIEHAQLLARRATLQESLSSGGTTQE